MIRFNCPHCRKVYQAADEMAGRTGRCKACSQPLTVPMAIPTSTAVPLREPIAPQWPPQENLFSSAIPPTSPPARAEPTIAVPPEPKKISMRQRRLQADADQMATFFTEFPLIQVHAMLGQPPEHYVVEYQVRSLMRGPMGQPVVCERHRVEIQLTREYPRQAPKCKMLSPIFHPNIEPAVICVGDHWTAGERLVDLVVRIGEMLAYQAYNLKSPLDGEAAMWTDLNKHRLPIDNRDLRPPERE